LWIVSCTFVSAISVIESHKARTSAGPQDEAHGQANAGEGHAHEHVEKRSLGLDVRRREILGAHVGLVVVDAGASSLPPSLIVSADEVIESE